MTTTAARYAVSASARPFLTAVATWQTSGEPEPMNLPANSSAWEWPGIDGMTRMLSEGNDIFHLLRLAEEAQLLTGPAPLSFNYEWDEDEGSALYGVRLGTYPGVIRLSTAALGWNETAAPDVTGVEWAMSVLEHAVQHANNMLAEFENYLAAQAPTLAAVS